jgi:FkbM family methyltransferase
VGPPKIPSDVRSTADGTELSIRDKAARLVVRAAAAAGYRRLEDWRALHDEENIRLLLSFSLSLDSNCIDVGCNEGEVLAEIIRVAPNGRHIAYEPLPHLHQQLVTLFPRVDIRQAALSNSEGTNQFLFVKNLPGYSGLRRRAYPRPPDIEVLAVRTERLDDHLDPDYVPTLIKIDVEGAEALVIEGAIQTLKRHRPIVLFEFGKGASDFYQVAPATIFSLLCEEAGLRIFDLDGNGPYDLQQLQQAYERNDRWNFVAHS